MWYLLEVRGENVGRRYTFDSGRIEIGRAETNDVRVDESAVEDHEAQIVVDGARPRLRALSSTPALRVNGDRPDGVFVTLNEGDRIDLAGTRLMVFDSSGVKGRYHEALLRMVHGEEPAASTS
jgi:pSer/pThr/pTyr-binding forkhead associated (FHA) protein